PDLPHVRVRRVTTTDPAGANGAKPRGRDAARTREMVLAGAMAECTAKGFAGARIDAVAERAGVNVRAIYQHFESKAALFDAVVGDSVPRRHERPPTERAGRLGPSALRGAARGRAAPRRSGKRPAADRAPRPGQLPVVRAAAHPAGDRA